MEDLLHDLGRDDSPEAILIGQLEHRAARVAQRVWATAYVHHRPVSTNTVAPSGTGAAWFTPGHGSS